MRRHRRRGADESQACIDPRHVQAGTALPVGPSYFDGNPEGPQMRVHGIGEQLDLLGRVMEKDKN
jgi:hypothetical protein